MEELAEQGTTAKASRSRLPGRIQLLTYLGGVLEDQEGAIIRWLVAGSI